MKSKIHRINNADLHALLYQWHSTIERDMPWKLTDDPYKIWVSEIIMQQTRVEQGTPYYLRFVERFPTVVDLAESPLDELLLLWQGLGYYSRARNMHEAAKYIVTHYDGIFPSDYERILDLKGVGKYTAAAVASFAYDLPYPVVDGNVKRVLSRLYDDHSIINTSQGEKKMLSLAHKIFDSDRPADFNQGIMDLGALICIPRNPDCQACPWEPSCMAIQKDTVTVLPKKKSASAKRSQYLHYLLLRYDGKIALRQRDARSIWKNLYELPYIESNHLSKDIELNDYLGSNTILTRSIHTDQIKHILSHLIIHAMILTIDLDTDDIGDERLFWISYDDIDKYAMPRILTRHLTK